MYAVAALILWALLLFLAPPAQNAFWGVNGLRSVTLPVAAGLVAAALLAALATACNPRSRALAAVVTLALAALLAFAMREKLHMLGDTTTRRGAIITFTGGAVHRPLDEWARDLHAQPLDLMLGLVLTSQLSRALHSVILGVSVVSFLLGLVYLAGAWRLARRLTAGSEPEWGLWLALVAWGGAQAFAGYAESAGVTLAVAVWWWGSMLSPLARPQDSAILVTTWALVALAHRTGLLLLVPLALRLLGPPLAGDQPGVRRAALVGTAIAVLAIVIAGLRAVDTQLVRDARELLRLPAPDTWRSLPTDLLNLLALSAPLAILAPLLAGREGLRRFFADARTRILLVAALPLLPLVWPLPVAGNGLGVHRDWDLSALLGLTLTIAGACLLASLPVARRRAALTLIVPLLVLGAGGWVAVNADGRASLDRVAALAEGEPALGDGQRSSLYLFYGSRLLESGDPASAARVLVASWELVPSPSRGFHAAIACMRAGDLESARRVLTAVRERPGLTSGQIATADRLLRQASAR